MKHQDFREAPKFSAKVFRPAKIFSLTCLIPKERDAKFENLSNWKLEIQML
jgi:hypothetical protein